MTRHLFQQLLGSFLRQICEHVRSRVARHLLQNVRGFFRVQVLHDLGCQPGVQFAQDRPSRFLIQGRDDALAFRGGELFHDVGQICRVQVFQLFVSDAQLHAPQGIRLDQVNELPADSALGKAAL